MVRHPNYRLVKIHYSYTVEEVAALFGKHKNTVRAWIREGLEPIDHYRPMLIHGPVLFKFLQVRRAMGKRSCPPGHMYCFRCRVPKWPAEDMADYLPMTATAGNLRAICPDCGTFMHRRVAFAKLKIVGAGLDIALPQAEKRLTERDAPSADCDFEQKVQSR